MQLDEARVHLAAKLDLELQTALANRQPAAAPVILVPAPGGLGKSRTVARLVRGRRVVWFGERIEMIEQLQQFLREPLPGFDPPDAVPAPAPTIEKRPARADDGMCANPTALDKARKAGLGRFEQRLVCDVCAQRGSCPYFQWKPTSSFVFAPHVWLSLQVIDSGLFDNREVVVIDEAFLSTVVRSTVVSPELVHSTASALVLLPDTGPARAFRGLFEALSDLYRVPPPGRHRIELRRLLADLGFVFTDGAGGWVERTEHRQPTVEELPASLRKHLKRERGAIANADAPVFEPTRITHRDVRMLLEQGSLPRQTNELLIGLFDALAADVNPRPTCVAVLPRDGWASGIVAGRFGLIDIPAHLPIVVLDATGQKGLYEELFPDRQVRVVDVDLEQRATLIQTVDHRYPQATLRDPKGKAAERLTGIIRWYRHNHRNEKIGVVVMKKLFDDLPLLKQSLLEVVGHDDVQHFWSLRGNNGLRDHDTLFIIGAPELPPLQIEAMCRAFIARSARAGNAPCSYTPRLIGGREPGLLRAELQDGVEEVLQQRGLDHPIADLVYQQMHHAELEQAILRIRPFEGDGHKTVFLLTNMPLPKARLDIQYTREAALWAAAPGRKKSRLEEARGLLLQKRQEGRTEPINQRELAIWLGVTEARISQWKKDHRGDPLLVQVLALLRGDPPG